MNAKTNVARTLPRRVAALLSTVLVAALLPLSSPLAQEPTQSEETTAAARPRVVLETTLGTMVLELYPDKAPGTVENFLTYVRDGFYDGTIFHRVIPDFMIQGGGFTPDRKQKPTRKPIQNEADNGLKNERGTVAMARTSDPHSATAQFFVNVVDNHYLDHTAKTARGWGYTVFGRVVEGMEVADTIAKVTTRPGGMQANWPVTDVVIQKAAVVE